MTSKDSTSLERQDRDFTSALTEDVRGMRIGIPSGYFGQGLDPEVSRAVLGAAQAPSRCGGPGGGI